MIRAITTSLLILVVLPITASSALAEQKLTLRIPAESTRRVRFAADRLAQMLAAAGLEASAVEAAEMPSARPLVILGNVARDRVVAEQAKAAGVALPENRESFAIRSLKGDVTLVAGTDDTGVLYGALALGERAASAKALPGELDLVDGPEFKLRGPAIGMQKMQRDPYGGHYHWPYSPKNFPFFYDKEHWTEYLDFLLETRMNSLYLWNGHPFSSLVKLDDYPEAVEVSEEVLQKNMEMVRWLTNECDKRGIWLIQMFYNIHLPGGLAKKYDLGTSINKPTPVASDYTRKSIAKFVELYPNVGLLVCLGEALSGGKPQVEWFTKTIIPGVQDGLKARGTDELPPIVVRGHHVVESRNHKAVMGEGLKLYPNLYTMVKFNGESLTTWQPRGRYQQFHTDMAATGSIHMANVHCLSNLEPFRYADFSFIWNSVRATRDRLDGGGLHLYPLAYWDWPNTPDKAEGTQMDRDRLWFEIWARYCWKIDRDPKVEREYWIGRLEQIYGAREAAEKIYEAYDASGECTPRLLRRFGITGGNRQCLSLGMRLDQMVHPNRYRVWKDLRASDSPPGETIQQYVTKELKGQKHEGETPPQIIAESKAFAEAAIEAVEAAAPHVTKHKQEFERVRNDMYCIQALTDHLTNTAQAAIRVVRHQQTDNPQDLAEALPYLEKSVEAYRRLTKLAGSAYRYSNTMHGRQRIPWSGVYHWSQVVDRYEKELEDFRKRVAAATGKAPAETLADEKNIKPLPAAKFKLLTGGMETYEVKPGAKVFTDRDYAVTSLAPELNGLTGIRFSHGDAKRHKDIVVEIDVEQPVKVLVGYFQEKRPGRSDLWLQLPNLEHVAHADERGGYDLQLRNAVTISDLPAVNVHAFRYEKGRQKIEMIGEGSYVILGVIPASAEVEPRDAARSSEM